MTDRRFMQRALELAENAAFNVNPNPAVGCVIVADGAIVGEGWTQPPGGSHAEIVALQAAGSRAKGACVYVTFEPCCHMGRTGPCTDALIAAGVARVVYAIDDPNPAVSGRGAQQLRAAGIEVSSGLAAAAARALNEGFISRMQRSRPFVRLKLAASLDGRTALGNGTSQWITGAPARADVHRWRARSAAVLTGIGTVLADDPRLDARPVDLGHDFAPPLRVVLDSKLRMPAAARMFEVDTPILIVTCADDARAGRAGTDDASADRVDADHADADRADAGAAHAALPSHARRCRVPADAAGRCDPAAVMALLGSLQINDVWVEAGAGLSGALLRAGLVDELIVYTAPVVLGDDARGMFGPLGLTQMCDRYEFEIRDVGQTGSDLRVVLRPGNLAASSAAP